MSEVLFLDELINPTFFTMELAILIIALLAMIVWLAIKLKSIVTLFGWVLSIVIFLMVILIELPFISFWIMVIITIIATLMVMAVRAA